MTAPAATVRVELPARAVGRGYDVRVGAGVLRELGPLARAALGDRPRRAMLVRDAHVPEEHASAAQESLERAGLACSPLSLTPSERGKSLATLERILLELEAAAHERIDPVVALGGGVVGDVAGFAAAVYRRGTPVVQCPTTLLAMVDASVGGKTGVNLEVGGGAGGAAPRTDLHKDLRKRDLRKNMVGAFHQPALVLADVRTLASLPARVFNAGLAECAKHAMLAGAFGDAGLLEWTESRAAGGPGAWDERSLVELISRNVRVKAQVVEADETESADVGGRALLNLGHTFAHAIEPLAGLSPTGEQADAPLLHGEAVALGLVAACRLGAELGVCAPALEQRVSTLLQSLGLPTRVAGLPDDGELIAAMARDKKVLGGRVRVVVPVAAGRCEVFADPPREALAAAWGAIRG